MMEYINKSVYAIQLKMDTYSCMGNCKKRKCKKQAVTLEMTYLS